MDLDSLHEYLALCQDEQQLPELFDRWLSISKEDRDGLDAGLVADCYDRIEAESKHRHLLLVMLALAGNDDHLHELVERLVTDPPEEWEHVAYALSPLLQSADWDVDTVFPRLLDAIGNPSVAAAALDVANYATRYNLIDPHPASDRGVQLGELLGGLAGQLGRLAENPRAFGNSVKEIQQKLEEAISLSVSLCDALGLIGDASQIGKLNQALAVHHRRVQTEAAGALARLGNEGGKQRLLELVSEPSARLRVLAYAEELAILDEIPPEFQSDDAVATAKLALWLSQPSQVGLPPQHLEVLDRRTQFWPSFTEPVDCTLVRYTYELNERQVSNIGITGPLTHAFDADMGNLPIDDIYAAYAGWHVEHSDIFEVAAESWNAAQRRAGQQLAKHLEHEGFESIQPVFLGILLDEHGLVARATRDEKMCLVATDGLELVSYPYSNRPSSLQPHDLWNIFKGRRMLRAFNTHEANDD